VNELAARLEVAPATVSLMVSDLSRNGILERREDEADRRRRIVSITEKHRPAIDGWLARGARPLAERARPVNPRPAADVR
jgi:DNA-binding MarR family transcriptional regulator